METASSAKPQLAFRGLSRLGRILRVLAEKSWGRWVDRLRRSSFSLVIAAILAGVPRLWWAVAVLRPGKL